MVIQTLRKRSLRASSALAAISSGDQARASWIARSAGSAGGRITPGTVTAASLLSELPRKPLQSKAGSGPSPMTKTTAASSASRAAGAGRRPAARGRRGAGEPCSSVRIAPASPASCSRTRASISLRAPPPTMPMVRPRSLGRSDRTKLMIRPTSSRRASSSATPRLTICPVRIDMRKAMPQITPVIVTIERPRRIRRPCRTTSRAIRSGSLTWLGMVAFAFMARRARWRRHS